MKTTKLSHQKVNTPNKLQIINTRVSADNSSGENSGNVGSQLMCGRITVVAPFLHTCSKLVPQWQYRISIHVLSLSPMVALFLNTCSRLVPPWQCRFSIHNLGLSPMVVPILHTYSRLVSYGSTVSPYMLHACLPWQHRISLYTCSRLVSHGRTRDPVTCLTAESPIVQDDLSMQVSKQEVVYVPLRVCTV